jgi:tetratricopeptide (TPR) repeat protein
MLAPHSGQSQLDAEIRRLQQAIPTSRQAGVLVERLGWMFVSKARESFDPGFYKLAEQCAICLDSRQPGSAEARLLRGHVLQNLHRFKQAEPLARSLVSERGLPCDYGLLGDTLMEQGRLPEAIKAYQAMVDLKPDAHAYARVAHMRWLKGDLEGALEAIRLAAGASSPQAAESAAWIHTRLALYALQAGDRTASSQACAAALEYQKDYPPALLIRGRILLADGLSAEAVEPLLRAARSNPLPEYQWILADTLRTLGRTDEARGVEQQLTKTGAIDDPRTFALFLSTRRLQPDTALELATRELKEREDVHTHDAMAWALAASDRWTEARDQSQRALAEGTDDARLLFHAGVIAAKLGDTKQARKWLASTCQHMLLPSEREQLAAAIRDLDCGNTSPLSLHSGRLDGVRMLARRNFPSCSQSGVVPPQSMEPR